MAKLKGLAALKAAGAIRGGDPKKVEITWKNDEGEEHAFDVWIKPMAFGTALDLQKDDSPNKMAAALATLVMLEDESGKRVPLDYDTAMNLHPGLGWEIVKAVNGSGEAPKNSQPPTNSSANSSSTESAAAPSQMRNETSA